MLTKRGLATLGLMILAYVLADVTALRILYLIFAALLMVFLTSYVQVRRAHRYIISSRDVGPNPCFEGALVRVDMVASEKGRGGGIILSLDDVLPPELDVEGTIRSTGSLRGYLRRKYSVRAKRRGVYDIGPIRATVTDIFGLMVSSFRVGERNTLTVYPRYTPIEVIRGQESSEMLGVSTTGSKGASPDFLRIRSYNPGDDVKTIHWRSSAKLGKLMVRELEKEEIRSTTIVLNCYENANRGRGDLFEIGVMVAASVSVSALKSNMEVSMILYGERVEVVQKDRGVTQYHRLLSALATVKPLGRIPLRALLGGLVREKWGSGTMHIISPSVQKRDFEAMTHLVQRGIKPVLIITGTLEAGQFMTRKIMGLGARVGLVESKGQDRLVISWMR